MLTPSEQAELDDVRDALLLALVVQAVGVVPGVTAELLDRFVALKAKAWDRYTVDRGGSVTFPPPDWTAKPR